MKLKLIYSLCLYILISSMPVCLASNSEHENKLSEKYILKLNEAKQKKYGPFVNGKLLFPTVIQNTDGKVLGLAYTTKESLQEALNKKKGIYYSRSRDGLWVKSPSGRHGQNLVDVRFNCDGTALLFVVEQLGSFCHEKVLSCFDASLNNDLITLNEIPVLRIGISKGDRQSQLAYDLLHSLGLNIYKNKASRNNQFVVKSNLYPNIEIVDVRHKDLETLFQEKYIDVAIAYDNVVPASLNKNYFKLQKDSGIKKVQVAAVHKKNKNISETPVIFTEYPDLSKEWCEKNFPQAKIIPIHGGGEQYVADGLADMAIVVVDSGITLNTHDLEVYETLGKSDLSVYYSEDTLKKYSNVIRKLKNQMQHKKIYFFDIDDRDNGYLSNFYPSKFVTHENAQEEVWKTSEHYYQANKFSVHSDVYKKIYAAQTAKETYKIAHQNESQVKKNWPQIKDRVMLSALNYKFDQNPDLKTKLLSTSGKELLEHSSDSYWGTGNYEDGHNKLGHMLMQVRDNLC